jgi:hypothetical protein
MPEAAYSSNMTEAVAVFHDVKTFQAAIDELLLAGFDHADINVLAQEDTNAKHLDQHLQHGGLLLWVRTRDADCEQRALEILRHHSARDVHLHQIPERACKESDVPRERPRVVHLLDREYSFDFLGRPPQP